MKKKGRFGYLVDMAREHPQFIKILMRVGWRNVTNLVDYPFLNGKSFRPKIVTFRISGQCNLHCQMCNYRHGGYLDASQMLPVDIFRQVIDDVAPYRPWISFTGGEPLLHPDIVECVRYVKNKGLHCALVTNGWNLARYAKDLVEAGVDTLTVSIDGPEELHDKIRGREGLYKRITEGVRLVVEREDRPLLFFSTTLQASNYTHLEQVVDDAIKAGVDGVSSQHLQRRSPDRTALHNQMYPEYQVRDGWVDESLLQVDTVELQEVLERAKQKGLFINVFPSLSPDEMVTWYTDPLQLLPGKRIKCPWMAATVIHDGTLRVCDEIWMGDLREESFWEIWNGPNMVAFRRQAKESETFPICATCCSLYRSHAL